MTRPSDIPEAVYEWAEIFCDEHIHTDDRELVARAFMAGQGAPAPSPRAGGLTAHQRDAFSFIEGYIAETGTSPSIEDIREHFGLASKSPAHRVVAELVVRGVITRMPFKARSISIIRNVSTAHQISGAA